MGTLEELSGRVLNLEKLYLSLPNKTDWTNLNQYNSQTFNTITTANNAQNDRITDIERYIVNLKLRQDGFTGYARYSEVIGNGSITSMQVNHNLDTKELHITLLDRISNQYASTTYTSVSDDAISLTFSSPPSTGQYLVVISS